MALPRPTRPELLIVAAFSRHEQALDWARQQLLAEFGPIGLESKPFHFNQTSYYAAEMGVELQKVFLVFERLAAPDVLAAAKLRTNELEAELGRTGTFPEPRPLNLDPGLLNLGKFMLATTKDQQHRLYLRDGIFAEVTLRYQEGAWHPWPWTYADYRQPEVLEFMELARDYYKQRLKH